MWTTAEREQYFKERAENKEAAEYSEESFTELVLKRPGRPVGSKDSKPRKKRFPELEGGGEADGRQERAAGMPTSSQDMDEDESAEAEAGVDAAQLQWGLPAQTASLSLSSLLEEALQHVESDLKAQRRPSSGRGES